MGSKMLRELTTIVEELTYNMHVYAALTYS